MSETIVRDIEGSLIDSGQFRYEPQHPAEITDAINTAKLHRVHGVLRDVGIVDDDLVIIDPKPRRLTDEEIRGTYGHRRMWWLRFSPEFYGTIQANPFDDEQSETHLITKDGELETMVYNFSKPLSEGEQESLTSALDWFNNFTHGQFDDIKRLVITDEWQPDILDDDKLPIGSPMGELYLTIPGTILLSRRIFDLDVGETSYGKGPQNGATLADIVITHELAHVLARDRGNTIGRFAVAAGWEEHNYQFGKWRNKQTWSITGQGHDTPGLPPTVHGYNPEEDFTDSAVYYRYNRDELDDARYGFFADLSESYKDDVLDDGQPNPVEIISASQPLYPYHRLPKRLGARVLTDAQYSQLEFMENMSHWLSGVVGMLYALDDKSHSK